MHNLYKDSDQVAARILAAALVIQHPKIQIVKAQAETYGFSCLFSVVDPFDEGLFPFIEQTMQQILSKEEIKISEMIRDSACEFLSFRGQKKKAKELKEWADGLVFILSVASYTDVLEEEIDLKEALEELKCFKLLDLTFLKQEDEFGLLKKQFVLKAIAASSSSLLKNKYKEIKQARQECHIKKGGESHLFSFVKIAAVKEVVYQPQGLKLKKEFLQQLKEYFKIKDFQEVGIPLFLEESEQAEAVFDLPCFKYLEKWFFEDIISTKVDSEEEELGLYSLDQVVQLSRVQKTVEINLEKTVNEALEHVVDVFSFLNLEVSVFLRSYQEKEKKPFNVCELFKKSLKTIQVFVDVEPCFGEKKTKSMGCEVVFVVKDLFERRWEVATIEIHEKKNPFYVRLNFISIERLIAIMLELSRELPPKVNLVKKI